MLKKQFVRFIIIGVFSTVVNYLAFYLLFHQASFNYMLASAFGFILGVVVGYSLNKYWTFEVGRDAQDQFVYKYGAVYLASLLLGLLFLKFLVGSLDLPPDFANFVTIGLTTCTNFIGVKYFVFKK